MDFKSTKFEIKELAPDGSFTGTASVFHSVDLQGDAVMPGAFAKSLQEKPQVPILLGHNVDDIIGITTSLEETHAGLAVTGKLVMDANPPAQKAYALMRAKALTGLSIGFTATREKMQNGVRQLLEIKLFEISLTGFPACEGAQVASVKTLPPDHREELAAINQLRQMIRKATP